MGYGREKEWYEIHLERGCHSCYYVDEKQLDVGPCCTFVGKLGVDAKGTCTKRKIKKVKS